jgi:hypothetical protein
MSARTLTARTGIVLSVCLVASACGDDQTSGPGSPTEEARSAAVVVDNAAEPAYIGSLFTGSASGSADAGDVIARIQANLALLFTLPSCTVVSNVVIDTSGPSALDAAFDHCTVNGQVALDGALHAELEVTDDPFTISYRFESDGLTVGERTLAGSWQVHHVFGEGPSTWSGDLTVTGPQGTTTATTDASFQVDGLCVTYSLDAQVESSDGRDLEVHADQVTRCLDACPTAGSVHVDGSAEGSLSWSYDGSGSVTATGSAAGSFDLDLACQ